MKKSKLIAEIKKQPCRGQWGKGVRAYKLELVEALPENVPEPDKAIEIMLNGADDWKHYSYGGSALVNNEDIARRLCTERALKVNHYGNRPPNKRNGDSWLDIQANALIRAAEEIVELINEERDTND